MQGSWKEKNCGSCGLQLLEKSEKTNGKIWTAHLGCQAHASRTQIEKTHFLQPWCFVAYLFLAREYKSVPSRQRGSMCALTCCVHLRQCACVSAATSAQCKPCCDCYGVPPMATELPRIPMPVTGLRNTKMAVMMITTYRPKPKHQAAGRCRAGCSKMNIWPSKFVQLSQGLASSCCKPHATLEQDTLACYHTKDEQLTGLFLNLATRGPACPEPGRLLRCTCNRRLRLGQMHQSCMVGMLYNCKCSSVSQDHPRLQPRSKNYGHMSKPLKRKAKSLPHKMQSTR